MLQIVSKVTAFKLLQQLNKMILLLIFFFLRVFKIRMNWLCKVHRWLLLNICLFSLKVLSFLNWDENWTGLWIWMKSLQYQSVNYSKPNSINYTVANISVTFKLVPSFFVYFGIWRKEESLVYQIEKTSHQWWQNIDIAKQSRLTHV